MGPACAGPHMQGGAQRMKCGEGNTSGTLSGWGGGCTIPATPVLNVHRDEYVHLKNVRKFIMHRKLKILDYAKSIRTYPLT